MKSETGLESTSQVEGKFLWSTSETHSALGHQESECSAEMRTILREFLADECLLTAKNQDTLCCYWSLTEECLATAAERKPAGGGCHEVIRLTWPATSLFDLNYRIIPISLTSCHEHVGVPHPGQVYQVEIGWICKNGAFITVLTSNRSDTH